MPKATFYKVVTETPTPGVYYPAFVLDSGMITPITYEIGKTTKPPEGWGPLAAFPSLPSAIDFLKEAAKTIPLPLNHTILKGTGEVSDYESLWYIWCQQTVTYHSVPLGTIFLDSFTPTEEVNHHA